MKWLQKPTPTQSLMAFMVMMLSAFLLVTVCAYLNWRYLGGKPGFIWIGAMTCLCSLVVLPRALRDIRTEVYRNAEAGREEPQPDRRSENLNLWNAISYVVLAGWGCAATYFYFFRAVIPLGAKTLLAIVLTLCVSLTVLNLRYAWLRWCDSRKTRTPLAAR